MEVDRVVLDSYALLAYLLREEGAERVRDLLRKAKMGEVEVYMNVVNLGEVYYTIARRKGVDIADFVVANLLKSPILFVHVDERLSLIAARIKAFHKLSYADAFAAATAIDLNAILLTGDDEFRSVEDRIRVEWL
ncbi:type II toxin-antitoxin system VapC family toxin [Thermococcus thermotolerans]|uniref:type II toxin-antitoxin system VapC family toxin n=1 Tax=Thermococcus thermotolerans TaxID=2969672 RepID=UPI002157305A|nr:type II toxin-antitoxin system VapC family toxin [Thermococcus thermotolerans]